MIALYRRELVVVKYDSAQHERTIGALPLLTLVDRH